MTAAYNRRLHGFSVFIVIWTVVLFVAGALVTSNGAALSVPDWPKSFHKWFPSLQQLAGGAFFEHSHRVIAGILGVLLIIEAVAVWRYELRRWLRWFALAAVAGVVAQAILGGEVVIRLLRFWLPELHACFAQIMFGAILCLAVFTSRWWVEAHPALSDRGKLSIHAIAIVNAVVTFIQVFLGAGFRHQDMPIWPHAAGSLAVLGVMIWTAGTLRRRFDASSELTFGRTLLHSLVGMQILLGVAAYWSRLAAPGPEPTLSMVVLTVVHTVVGALVFGGSILVVLMCYRLVPRRGALSVPSKPQTAE